MIDVRNLIIKFALNEDQKAFGEFFNHYYPRLLRFALFMVKSDILAEEVVSDVFVKVWKNRKRIAEIENIDTYMFTSIRNQSFSYLKKRNLETVPLDQVAEYTFINISNPECELLDKELIIKVEEAIQKLPPKCQMIFHLSRDEGFKYDEVAQILEISKSTVKNQMTIALKKIKEEFSSYFGSADDKKYKFLMSLFLA